MKRFVPKPLRAVRLTGVAGLLLVASLVAADPAAAEERFIVDDTADLADASLGDGKCETATGTCTLRAAVEEADHNPGPDVDIIRLEAETYELSSAQQLSVNPAANIRIIGQGVAATTIDGLDATRHFSVVSGLLYIEGLTLTNGFAVGDGGSIRVQIGSIRLKSVAIVDSQAGGNGGGLSVGSGSTVVINTSEFVGNQAGARGGGIFTFGWFSKFNRSLIANNEATSGGGVAALGPLTMRNVTVSGNTARASSSSSGGTGGVDASTNVILNNLTITGNTGFGGSGKSGGLSGESVVMKNTIVAGNTVVSGLAPDCLVRFSAASVHNLIGNDTFCGPASPDPTWLLAVDPELSALADNGGPTRTHALASTSPAVDSGRRCELFDQRGIIRGPCDIGAYEINQPLIQKGPIELNGPPINRG